MVEEGVGEVDRVPDADVGVGDEVLHNRSESGKSQLFTINVHSSLNVHSIRRNSLMVSGVGVHHLANTLIGNKDKVQDTSLIHVCSYLFQV